MDKFGREGHRSRIRNAYITNGAETMSDVHIVELFLSLLIPRKDVKPIAYSLFNRFGSIEKIFSADYDELVEINGIGKNTAVNIMMYNDLMKRSNSSTNEDLYDSKNRLAFAKLQINNDKKYRIVFVGGDGDCVGDFCFSSLDIVAKNCIVENIISHNCNSLFVVRYGSENILGDDVNFISEFKFLVNPIGVNFIDYIAVGIDECVSINDTVHYKLLEN